MQQEIVANGTIQRRNNYLLEVVMMLLKVHQYFLVATDKNFPILLLKFAKEKMACRQDPQCFPNLMPPSIIPQLLVMFCWIENQLRLQNKNLYLYLIPKNVSSR